jgi:hypothetical protein
VRKEPESEVISSFDRLLGTRNSKEPFSILTHFGKYVSIHADLTYFSDKTQLSRLAAHPTHNADNNEEFHTLTVQWHKETMA